MKTSSRLMVFEGPDGSGKSTLARAYADATGARYVHLGPFPEVGAGLARLYVEAITPAVLGLSDVVLDRSWLSERIYGDAFRGGHDRLGPRLRLVERLAWRCATLVVRLDAPWDAICAGYAARKGVEMLENETQLRRIYDDYLKLETSLPAGGLATFTIADDGIRRYPLDKLLFDVEFFRKHRASVPHPLAVGSAGNLGAPILIVSDGYPNVQDGEPLIQWPFGSLSGRGCSIWLAMRLAEAGIGEDRLCWANADSIAPDFAAPKGPHVVALGGRAGERLAELGIDHARFPHPQTYKKFYADEPYPVIQYIKEALS
jgi:thymidylate kinase